MQQLETRGAEMKNVDKFHPYIESASRTVTDAIILKGLSFSTLTNIYRNFLTQLPPFTEEEFDCVPGCGYCCHLKASISVAEALIILGYLQEHDQLCQYKERVENLRGPLLQRAVSDNSWWLENSIPCLFLDQKTFSCTIYEVRPFTCRAYHSLDIQRCKTGFFNRTETAIPCYPDFKRSRELYSVAFELALADLGLQSDQFELSSTIGLFLQSPHLVKEWAQGKRVLPSILSDSGPS
jgi:Fe-S-cluster containining protein